MNSPRHLLVVAAHPDDEVLGCGATVRKLVNEGWTAGLIIMTGGISGRRVEVPLGEIEIAQDELARQMRAASAILGYSDIAHLNFPDNRLDTVGRNDLVRAIYPIIEKSRPALLMTHHPADYNWDHGAVFDAATMAARHSPGDPVLTEIWCFEVLSSSERGWRGKAQPFSPNIYVDVAATLKAKQDALRAYAHEIRKYPHPRSAEGIENLARKRGNEVGMTAAECFELVRRIVP